MIYDWYRIFSLAEFRESGLSSRTYNVLLEGLGQKSILVTAGSEYGVLFEDTFLVLGFDAQNPYARDGRAVYVDSDENVYLGIEVVE